MAKKKRISENAFSWVKDTSIEGKANEAYEETPENTENLKTTSVAVKQRSICVKYYKSGNNVGQIVATLEVDKDQTEVRKQPWSDATGDKTFKEFVFTDNNEYKDLLTSELIEIYRKYKVSNGKLDLVTP